MGLRLAFKAFFRAWRDRSLTEKVIQSLPGSERPALPAPPERLALPASVRAEPVMAKAPVRSEALTLLAALQREARLIDFLKEDLSGYDDAQVGAAVRDVHRDCAAAIERMFALRPLRDQEEGMPVEVAEGFDPMQVKLTGQVTGQPPFRGILAHQGWQVTRCDVPEWIGHKDAARVIAPAEVEIH